MDKSLGLNLTRTPDRMIFSYCWIFQTIAKGRENQAIAVQIRADQEHRPTDGLETDGRSFATHVFEMPGPTGRPRVQIEAPSIGTVNAMRMQNVTFITQQPVDRVRRIIADIDVDP
jgi:hypothetical protein